MARILFTVNYTAGSPNPNVVQQVLRIDEGDQVEFATQTKDLAIKFAQGLPPGQLPVDLKAGQVYKIPLVEPRLTLRGTAPVHFECGTHANGTFTPYKDGGEVPGGGPG